MLNEPSKIPLQLWSPRYIGIMTLLFMPGGWFLGILNLHRLGYKREMKGHLIFILGVTLLLVVLAAFEVDLPNAIGILFGMIFGSYMYNTNTSLIKEYRAEGGAVEYASGLSGFFIVIGAT